MTEPSLSADENAKMLACYDMLKRTGAQQVQLRWSEDEKPTVWFAVAIFVGNNRFVVGAAFHPVLALIELAEKVVDGGICSHCTRPTGLDVEPHPMQDFTDALICWIIYDPELKTFRRACEGEWLNGKKIA